MPALVMAPRRSNCRIRLKPCARLARWQKPRQQTNPRTRASAATARPKKKQAKADKPASKTEKDNKVDSKAVDKDKLGKDKERDSSKNTEAPRAPTVKSQPPALRQVKKMWPSWVGQRRVKVINRFTDNNKGIDIGSKTGQPVLPRPKAGWCTDGSACVATVS